MGFLLLEGIIHVGSSPLPSIVFLGLALFFSFLVF